MFSVSDIIPHGFPPPPVLRVTDDFVHINAIVFGLFGQRNQIIDIRKSRKLKKFHPCLFLENMVK